MATHSRLLEILLLYSDSETAFSAEQIAEHLNSSISTIYRDLQKLRNYGFIEQFFDDQYVLGGKISILDRVARLTNPLLVAAEAEMERLSQVTGLTVTLTRLYENAVIGLGQIDGNPNLSVGYERGQVVPLFHGCTGKVILAALPWRHLKRIFEANKNLIYNSGLGEDWHQFRTHVRNFGAQPTLWTYGEVTPENYAISIVLLNPSDMPLGSLTIIIRRAMEAEIDHREIEMQLIQSQKIIRVNLAEPKSAVAKI